MQIYAFAFQLHNVSSATLYKLDKLEHRTLLWGVKSIDNYVEKIQKIQPDYILGMGIYTRKDKNFLHLETKTLNKFRKYPIDNSIIKELPLKPYLKETEYLKQTQTIGNSYCNYVTWKIITAIQEGKLKTKYTFIHIPKNFEPGKAAEIIQKQLQ